MSKISTDELYEKTLEWAKKYNSAFAEMMQSDIEYTKAAINIERHTEKDPKRFTTFKDVENQILFFYDSERENLRKQINPIVFSDSIDISDKLKLFVDEYEKILDLNITTEDWFNQLKEI